MDQEGSFAVSVEAHGDVPVVRVTGEVDLATIAPFERALLRAISVSTWTVVDLTDCAFIDSSGIGAIIRAHRLLGDRVDGAAQLRLVVSQPALVQTLERVGIDSIAGLYNELGDALAANDLERAKLGDALR